MSHCSVPLPSSPPSPPALPDDDGALFPDLPPISPSFSLPSSLDIEPFTPSRPHVSSSRSPSLHRGRSGSGHSDNLLDHERRSLAERLRRLASRMSTGDAISEDNFENLQVHIGSLELVFDASQRIATAELPAAAEGGLEPRSEKSQASEDDAENLPVPGQQTIDVRDGLAKASDESPEEKADQTSGIARQQAHQIIAEAHQLREGMEAVIESLQSRQEEAEHIHELLITRAERAAQRIIHLERRVQEIQSERDEGEMEILSLQFQLKALELQHADPTQDTEPLNQDLRDSISAWKTEWSTLKRKRSRKKADGGGRNGRPVESPKSPQTPRLRGVRASPG